MRIAILGAGGVGGYFGALLAQAGHDVTFLARGKHLRAMQDQGLQVKSPHGDFVVNPVKATARPAEVGPVTYVVVAVKRYQLEAAAASMAPLVGPGTTVAPLLNGVDAHQALIGALGPEPVIGGLCSIVSMVERPGLIRQESELRRVVLGELDGRQSERVEQLVRAWRECGVEAIHSEDIHRSMWTKFLFIASLGGVSSLGRATMGEIRAQDATIALLRDAMWEVASVAQALGVEVGEEEIRGAMQLVAQFEASATSSMQRDVVEGRPFELEAFSGTVVRKGAAAGVETPVHRAMYALLLPALAKAQAVG
jgi:2-dehydropantoate 2-reductase